MPWCSFGDSETFDSRRDWLPNLKPREKNKTIFKTVFCPMARSILDPRLCFACESVDEVANVTRELQLLYFYCDNTVEIKESRTQKTFLRRIECSTLSRSQFFVGGSVVIFGRVIRLKSYGDEVTRQLCEKAGDSTVVVIPLARGVNFGSDLAILTEECGFTIRVMETLTLLPNDVAQLGLPASYANAPVVAIQVVRENPFEYIKRFIARVPTVFATTSMEQVRSFERFLTGSAMRSFANPPADISVVLIKPHIVLSRLGGEVVDVYLRHGLRIAAIRQIAFSAHQVDALLQPYKGVLPTYSDTVHDTAGVCWAVQLTSTVGSGAFDLVREVSGPFDPAVAKALYPDSVRAQFGKTKSQNAVHCADLLEDCAVYTEALFAQK